MVVTVAVKVATPVTVTVGIVMVSVARESLSIVASVSVAGSSVPAATLSTQVLHAVISFP